MSNAFAWIIAACCLAGAAAPSSAADALNGKDIATR